MRGRSEDIERFACKGTRLDMPIKIVVSLGSSSRAYLFDALFHELHCLLLRQVWVPQPIQHRQHKVRPCSKAMTTSIDCAVLPTSRWLGDSMQP